MTRPNCVVRRTAALGASLFLLVSCAHEAGNIRKIRSLTEDGRWLSAGELVEQALKDNPGDPKAREAMKGLLAKVMRGAENTDFDPVRYFYAQAFLDYFRDHRYLRAIEDLEQVLVYQLENEEVLGFIDKAQVHVDQEVQENRRRSASLLADVKSAFEARDLDRGYETAQKVLVLDPSNADARQWIGRIQEELERRARDEKEAAAKLSRRRSRGNHGTAVPSAASARPRLKPDSEWLELQYREALKAYVRGDIRAAAGILRELLIYDPGNDRWQRSLKRIEQELPKG